MNRIEPLDWLRGFMACSIMIYHYTFWVSGPMQSESILGRLGIYGVSTFYILSGLSLAIVYNSKLSVLRDNFTFFIRRLFRILPLMWIVTTFILIRSGTSEYSIPTIIMNYTATFGFIDPANYIMTGGWSIGNEMVFYALFPLFIYIYQKSKMLGNILTLVTIIVELLILNYYLISSEPLSYQWREYINPFNQLFLFALGIFIYYNFKDLKIKIATVYKISFVSVVIFCFYPITGDTINLVTGINRFILSFACVLIVLAFYKLQIKINNRHTYFFLNSFGVASYSIYLLHPIVFFEVKAVLLNALGITSNYIIMSISIFVTLFLSWIIYKIYEEQFIKVGKKLTSDKKKGEIQEAV